MVGQVALPRRRFRHEFGDESLGNGIGCLTTACDLTFIDHRPLVGVLVELTSGSGNGFESVGSTMAQYSTTRHGSSAGSNEYT